MLDKGGEITMKKYIKPTANIVELSVKESLSDLPSGFNKPGASDVYRKTAAYGMTVYTFNSSPKTQNS